MATSTAASEHDDPELTAAAWDLDPLVDGREEAGVQQLLEDAQARASGLAAAHSGRVAELDAAGLEEAMRELATIHELVGRAASYASLRFSTDTADPARGALLQKVQELGTSIETTLLFFDLEWAAVPDERAEELLAAEGLDFCRHHLRNVRRYRPHLLSEPEEKIVSEKTLTGRSAWSRLFEELTSAIDVRAAAQRRRGRAGDGGPRRRAQPPGPARPGGAAHRRRSGHRSARARIAHAGVHLQHAAGRQVRRRSAAPLPELAGLAQPGQRGQRRIGAVSDRGGARPL